MHYYLSSYKVSTGETRYEVRACSTIVDYQYSGGYTTYEDAREALTIIKNL